MSVSNMEALLLLKHLVHNPPSAAAMRCTATGCTMRPSAPTHCRHHDSCDSGLLMSSGA